MSCRIHISYVNKNYIEFFFNSCLSDIMRQESGVLGLGQQKQ